MLNQRCVWHTCTFGSGLKVNTWERPFRSWVYNPACCRLRGQQQGGTLKETRDWNSETMTSVIFQTVTQGEAGRRVGNLRQPLKATSTPKSKKISMQENKLPFHAKVGKVATYWGSAGSCGPPQRHQTGPPSPGGSPSWSATPRPESEAKKYDNLTLPNLTASVRKISDLRSIVPSSLV